MFRLGGMKCDDRNVSTNTSFIKDVEQLLYLLQMYIYIYTFKWHKSILHLLYIMDTHTHPYCVCVCVCVCVCLCGHVYVVYEDTNLYNDMGMT